MGSQAFQLQLPKRRQVRIPSRDRLQRERTDALGVEFPQIFEQFGPMAHVKEIEPAFEDKSKPARPSALVPKIDDVNRPAALDVGQGRVDRLLNVGIIESE